MINSIKAVIYDMDGVIINSEPCWREAIISTFRKVGLSFTEEMCQETMGMRLIEVVEYWYHKTPWQGMSIKEVDVELLKTVTQLILEKGKILPGVVESLEFFKSKSIQIGLASSSASNLINVGLQKLQIAHYFEVINSAEHLQYGKPHPEIYIKTAQQLNVNPINCLVIEDSLNGVISGKSAMMKVIAIPENENKNDKRFNVADIQLGSLHEIINLKFI